MHKIYKTKNIPHSAPCTFCTLRSVEGSADLDFCEMRDADSFFIEITVERQNDNDGWQRPWQIKNGVLPRIVRGPFDLWFNININTVILPLDLFRMREFTFM